jgi:hypothetical protein
MVAMRDSSIEPAVTGEQPRPDTDPERDPMRLEILQVPGCPNVALLEQRLDQALAGHPAPVERAHRVVDDLATAHALGMTGSPTLLVDGVDPSAEPGLAPSVSCRLYRDDDGRAHGAPSVDVLRRVLGVAVPDPALDETGAVTEDADCCVNPGGPVDRQATDQ